MVATLYLIRHGDREGGPDGRYVGWSDPPLSADGRWQVAKVAGALARAVPPPGLQAVYCSDLRRAVESAEIVAGPLGLVPVAKPDLRERNFGAFEGLNLEEILHRHPAAYAAWGRDPWGYTPPGGEGVREMTARVLEAFDGIRAAHPGASVAVVAHGGVNRIFLAHCLGMPADHLFRIGQAPAALSIVEFHHGTPVVQLFNGGGGGA